MIDAQQVISLCLIDSQLKISVRLLSSDPGLRQPGEALIHGRCDIVSLDLASASDRLR